MTAPRTDPQSTVPVEPLSAEEALARELHSFVHVGPWAAETETGWHETHLDHARAMIAGLRRFGFTLDAARASRPVTATALRKALGDIDAICGLCRGARTYRTNALTDEVCDRSIHALVDKALAALPVREDSRPVTAMPDALMERLAIIEATASDIHDQSAGQIRAWARAIAKLASAASASLAALPVREDEPTEIDASRIHRITCKRLIEHTPGSDKPYLWPCTEFVREYDRLTREASHVR